MDTNPAIRESTVKSMVTLATKLNTNNLNVILMRHFARLQGLFILSLLARNIFINIFCTGKDDQPSIRTNTTICLGKIGGLLAPANRQTILISAFTRATKDPFPAARLAAVLAMSATQQYYALAEIANKLLPAIVPLTFDTDKQVCACVC
jgi:SCY1-like protein 1